MTDAATKDVRLGFLTAIDVAGGGYVGGLLVTNHQGRPLEFQCTAPVKPNRMQEILYGPTLQPFVLGELIGQTLIDKAGVKPHLILTEEPDLLELRNHTAIPVACINRDAPDRAAGSPAGQSLALGRQRLRFHEAHQSDRNAAERCATLVPRDADMQEPFERIREALNEALNAAAVR